MNGFQSLSYWKDYFNNPKGGRLGVLNAIQASRLIYIKRVKNLTSAFTEYWVARILSYCSLSE